MSKSISAYTILQELGNARLRDYIHGKISTRKFDSHDFTNNFESHFPEHYERMLAAHSDGGDLNHIRQIIANRMGIYLGRNRLSLGIDKIGTRKSVNLNRTITATSLWRKTK